MHTIDTIDTIDTTTQATPKQIELITRLTKERDLSMVWVPGMPNSSPEGRSTAARAAVEIAREYWEPGFGISKTAASTVLDYLLDAPKLATPAAAPVATTGEPAPEGMHRLGSTIYKVQVAVHGSGRPYAKALTEVEAGRCPGHRATPEQDWQYHQHAAECDQWVPGEWKFIYAVGAVRKLSPATLLPLDEAKAFGRLYGVCCVCGRTLTDETSIAEGIGPVCGARL